MAGGSDVLARKYVEFAMRGQGSIQAAMRDIGKELTRAKGRAQLLNKHLNDGTYQKAANQLAAIRRQYAAMGQAARFQDLIAEHGRFGASLITIQERMAGLTRAAGVGFGVLTATTMGWVTAGMQGTVEAYRLQMGFTQLSREIAGVFKPTIDDATSAVYKASQWFRGLSGSQQETIRTTVLWSAGLMGGVLVLNMTVKAVAALRAMLLATGGAMKGMGAAMTGMFGMSGWKSLLAMGAVGAAIYGVHKATKGPTDSAEDQSVPEKLFNTTGRTLSSLWDNTVARLYKDDAEIAKRNRRRKLEEREQWGMLTDPEKAELKGVRAEDEKKKGGVSLNQTGFDAIGSGWDRMANEVIKMSDPAERAAGLLEAIKTTLDRWEASGGATDAGGISRVLADAVREKGF